MPPIPDDRDPFAPDLPAILADLWERLEDAAVRAPAPFHLPTLCTVEDGAPEARTVVLRHADRSGGGNRGEVGCHADLRSPKVAQVRADPRCAWVFYDRDAKVQVRLNGTARVIADGPAVDAAWEATPPSARRCYLAPWPPGAATGAAEPNLPPEFRHRDPTPAESAPGRNRFALLRTTADRLDWLALHHAGHRRARFEWRDGGWRGDWVAV